MIHLYFLGFKYSIVLLDAVVSANIPQSTNDEVKYISRTSASKWIPLIWISSAKNGTYILADELTVVGNGLGWVAKWTTMAVLVFILLLFPENGFSV